MEEAAAATLRSTNRRILSRAVHEVGTNHAAAQEGQKDAGAVQGPLVKNACRRRVVQQGTLRDPIKRTRQVKVDRVGAATDNDNQLRDQRVDQGV